MITELKKLYDKFKTDRILQDEKNLYGDTWVPLEKIFKLIINSFANEEIYNL